MNGLKGWFYFWSYDYTNPFSFNVHPQFQLVFLSAAVLLAGFTIGFNIGVHEKGKRSSSTASSTAAVKLNGGSGSAAASLHGTTGRLDEEKRFSLEEEKNSDYYQATVQNLSPGGVGVGAGAGAASQTHEANELPFHSKLFFQLSADSIRHNLRWAVF